MKETLNESEVTAREASVQPTESYAQEPYPSSNKIRKGIITPGVPISPLFKTAYPPRLARRVENTVILSTRKPKIPESMFLIIYKELQCV